MSTNPPTLLTAPARLALFAPAVALLALCAGAFAANPAPAPVDGTAADPAAELRSFKVGDGFEVNLFASDPQVIKPIAMNFDAAGRLWVASSETYPQVKPGQAYNDKVFVLEDADGDGRCDKSTVFADGLLIPTGIAPGDGGCYVANSTEMVHLKDTDGDGKADQRRVVLAGFGTEDTHHILHTFRWGPDGRLYMEQSIYIHSQIETPRGIKKLDAGGVWRYRTDSQELDVFFTGLINGWGYVWNEWGQTFATDGAGGEGINFVIPGCNFTATPAYTPGAGRVLKGLNPGSPKYCGLEVVSGRGMPDDMQGDLITADFRANRVVRYKLTQNGAGFDAKLQPDLITSKDKAFRPVDIKMGPDGALYIADFYNPIINHGEVDFRDPRRDHVHGRIWRVTAKGRPAVERPKLVGAKVEEVLDGLLSPEGYTRQQAKHVLRERGAKEVAPALGKWLKGLLSKGRDGPAFDAEHAKLEALWAYESIDTATPQLLKEVLGSSNPLARAAACRVAGHWAGQVEDAQALLAPLVTDDDPRVRMEAVRALAAVQTPEAVTVAMRALDKQPVDPFLDYALYKTAVDLQDQWLPVFRAGKLNTWADARHLNFALQAVKSPDAMKNLVAQLKAGQVPPDARRDLYELVASMGTANDLGVLLEQAASDKVDEAGKAAALRAVERAVRQRKVTPAPVPADALKGLIASHDPDLAAAAMRAAAALRVDVQADLEKAAAAPETPKPVRLAAVESLATLGPDARQAATFFLTLTRPDKPMPVRTAGVAGMAALDVQQAAGPAGELFAAAKAEDDLSPVIAAFLKRERGADALATALSGRQIAPDVAKLSLRYIQGIGQDLPALTEVLRKGAGVAAGATALSPDEMKWMMDEVTAKGDPARGEQVFRSKTAGCYQCHAIGGAGGTLAPDLRSVGAASPLDYIIDSVLQPNKALKDGYDSILVTTRDGDVIQGIKVREDAKELVLRDNLRDEITIATADVRSRKPGGSLMPAGLADGLTRQEFLDLIRFMSELGKPGPYAVPNDPVVRRWRVLDPVPDALAAGADPLKPPPAGDAGWWPAYSLVSGVLPADALGTRGVGYARAQVDATTPGKVKLRVDSPKGLALWVDGRPVELAGPETELNLSRGVHTLTFRVDTAAHGGGLRVQFADVSGSAGHVQPLSGK